MGRSRSLNVSLVCDDFWRLSGLAPAGPLVSYSVAAILGHSGEYVRISCLLGVPAVPRDSCCALCGSLGRCFCFA